MFGYVNVNKKELKGKEMDRYQAYYCGLCRALKERHGMLGQMTLSYDMTFMVMLLTGLYEPENREYESHCVLHPFAKQHCVCNPYTEYGADMNVLVSYYKCLDDWEDERKVSRLLLSRMLAGKNDKIRSLYEEKANVIREHLQAIHVLEQENCPNLDAAAGHFGHIMEALILYRVDEWEKPLRKVGFYLGKFLYLMDAYEDMERDCKTGNYNPVLLLYQTYETDSGSAVTFIPEFEERMEQVLRQMMAECAHSFEHLPIVEEIAILRNILYSGVWARYALVSKKRRERAEKHRLKKQERESRRVE